MTAGDGVLVVVATPIGNLGDLSPRAVQELGRADVVACEDTRRTGALLRHAGVKPPPLLVVNEHTEASQVPEVLNRLARGERVALVSDAGMPGVSDPGERLVRAAAGAGVRVEVVPGPSAAVAALVVSGLPTARVAFEGFLPRSGSARSERLGDLAADRRTVVLFEAPHRLARTLGDLVEVCGGDRDVVLVREMTKIHEEVWRGTLAEAVSEVAGRAPRGEYVVVLAGSKAEVEVDDEVIEAALDRERAEGRSTRDAVDAVAAGLGVARRRVYALATRR